VKYFLFLALLLDTQTAINITALCDEHDLKAVFGGDMQSLEQSKTSGKASRYCMYMLCLGCCMAKFIGVATMSTCTLVHLQY